MPSYSGEEATLTYSCTANSTCNSDIHILARIDHGVNYHPTGQSAFNSIVHALTEAEDRYTEFHVYTF